MDKSRRSVVKHRTNAPQRQDKDRKKGGFRSVGANLPDGAYLGKAKKLKANLIQNAKIKSKFYKQQSTSGSGSGSNANETPLGIGKFARENESEPESNPLGRFARQNGSDDEEQDFRSSGNRQRQPKRQSKEVKPSAPMPEQEQQKKKPRYNSREEALEARKQKSDKWTKTAKSKDGQARKQPSLNGRMEILLDKIQHQ
ncbi:unnamed protein product [Sympodiomycopsis kandeliae]